MVDLALAIRKHLISPVVFRLAKLANRYADWAPEETVTEQTEPVPFEGDLPPGVLDHCLRRRMYTKPRPLVSRVEGVTYTPLGMAWIDGRLERRYCFEEVGLRQLTARPGCPTRDYAQATLLQSETPHTFGDWMGEHVVALSLALQAGAFVAPLLLPRRWFSKPYVQRDLALMGIQAECVDTTVTVRQATVLHKVRPNNWWTRNEVYAVMDALSVVPRPAKPGTALYLSRRGLKGEGPQRSINNATTEAAMAAAGVRVVRTADCSLEDYKALAADAETVFSDHGSANYNMMWWQPQRYVELFAPDYWDGSFLLVADAIGVLDYNLWRIDPDVPVERLTERIRALLKRPLRPVVQRRVAG